MLSFALCNPDDFLAPVLDRFPQGHRERVCSGPDAHSAAAFSEPFGYRFGTSFDSPSADLQSVDRQSDHATVLELGAGQLWPSRSVIRLQQRMTRRVGAINQFQCRRQVVQAPKWPVVMADLIQPSSEHKPAVSPRGACVSLLDGPQIVEKVI
jgi:hypothetical protein